MLGCVMTGKRVFTENKMKLGVEKILLPVFCGVNLSVKFKSAIVETFPNIY